MGLTFLVAGHEAEVDVTSTSTLFGVNIAVIGYAGPGYPDVETSAQQEPGDTGHENYRKLLLLNNPARRAYEQQRASVLLA